MTPDPRASTVFDSLVSGLKAFNLLAAQEDVDPRRVGITGISWGGATTLALAGLLEDRVTAAFSLYGSGYYLLSDAGIGNVISKRPKDEQDIWMACFDPARAQPEHWYRPVCKRRRSMTLPECSQNCLLQVAGGGLGSRP